jgi:predicted Zn-dependent peptidase
VKLANGMAAYLAPDRTLPLVTITVLTRVGPDLDPPGKEGLAAMMMHLLTRGGTQTMTAEQLEERVAFLGAQLESSMGGGGGRGPFGGGGPPITGTEGSATINLLAKDMDEGLALLTGCLRGAAFQPTASSSGQSSSWRTSSGATTRARASRSTRNWPDARRESLVRALPHRGVGRVDHPRRPVAFQRRYLGPKNFVLAVSGDFDRASMTKKLESAFGKWPTQGELAGPPAAPTTPSQAGWFVAGKDVNQTRVSIGVRALDRYDPDYYAALVMNYVLGGGGFTSRLVNRIRSDEGLAYSVNSRFEGGAYYADPWRLVYQTKVRSTPYATQIALEELRKIREKPVTQEELDTAKNSFIEGFPSRFPTTTAIAGALAAEEITGRYARDPGWFGEYAKRIGAVTLADVQRVAQRLLDPAKMTFLFVGNAKEMSMGDGKHDVTLVKLAGGEPKALALRDPATMKPLP